MATDETPPNMYPNEPQPRAVPFGPKKGGTGKTLLSINTAERLANEYGRDEVLYVDLDPEGNATQGLQLREEHWDDDVSLNDVLTGDTDPHDVIVEADRFDVIPAHKSFGSLEYEMQSDSWGVTWVRKHLVDELLGVGSGKYRFIILDTAGGGPLADAAIAAGQCVVIPLKMDSVNVNGLRNTLESQLAKMGEEIDVDILAIVPNDMDSPGNINTHENEMLKNLWDSPFQKYLPSFASPDHLTDPDSPGPGIRSSAALNRAYQNGGTLVDEDPEHPMLERLDQLAATVAWGGVEAAPDELGGSPTKTATDAEAEPEPNTTPTN